MCQKLDELAQALLNLLSRFGLNAVFSCWLEGDEWPHYYSHSGVASPLEQDLMQSGHGGGRIMEFGRRMLVNYPRTALLIKNVPYEEEARFGRIKDHLAVVLSAADARVSSLNMEERLRQKDRLLDVVSDVKQALLDVQKRQDEMKVRAANERDDVKLELREELLTLGLHEEQEERMLSLVMDFLKSLEGLYNEAMDWQKDLEPVMDAVEYVVSGGESSA